MGGTDDNNNLCLLTAREHFLCHLLLTKMIDHSDKKLLRKVSSAFIKMAYSSTKYQKERQIRSRDFAYVRKNNSDICKHIQTGKKLSDKTREKMRNTRIGMKLSDDAKEKISKALKINNGMKDTKFYQNGERIIRLKPYEEIPEGFKPGRILK